jgi:hypothetical protein
MPTDSEGRAQRGDWTFKPPASMAPLRYDASFDATEFATLQRGLTPRSSDDKWFIYWHDERLWIHRSWTGFLTYTIAFRTENGRQAVADAQVSTDRAQYGGQPAEDEQLFVDWLLRNLVLGDERVEMPIPTALRDSVGASGDSTEKPDSEDAPGDEISPLGDAWSRIAGVAYELARPLLRRLTRLQPRLANAEVEAIVAKHIRGHGLNWVPRIEYISEPPVAFVSPAHKDGPNHDFVEAHPFFVDLADGLVSELEWHHMKRGWDAAEKVAPPGLGANEWIERLLTDPANRERWVQVCLSDTLPRYRHLPSEF